MTPSRLMNAGTMSFFISQAPVRTVGFVCSPDERHREKSTSRASARAPGLQPQSMWRMTGGIDLSVSRPLFRRGGIRALLRQFRLEALARGRRIRAASRRVEQGIRIAVIPLGDALPEIHHAGMGSERDIARQRGDDRKAVLEIREDIGVFGVADQLVAGPGQAGDIDQVQAALALA